MLKLISGEDREFVMRMDKHIDHRSFDHRVYTENGYIIMEGGRSVGFIAQNVLWGNIPFMELISVCEEERGRGYGTRAILEWEDILRGRGFKMALLSTQVDEGAQHLYRRLGYTDCGGLLFDNTPFEQPMEMFMRKVL